ncbi:MAG: DUF932 domain-containing protein [Desulfobacterales bacterium]
MKETAKLETLIENVHSMAENYYDDTVPVHDMEFDSASSMRISGQHFEVLPSAQKLFANRLRVPYSYLSRCPANLQAENLNFWIAEEQKKRRELFCRFDGNKLRAVFTNRYEPVDHMELLSRMLQYGFEPHQEVRCLLNQEMLVVSVPEYDRTFRVGEKDNVVPGITVSNSEVGVMALSIDAFYYRLVCSNGLIAKTSVAAKYKHISRKGIDNFPLVLEDVVQQSRQGQGRFMISAQTPVDDPISSIETFARQFQLPQNEVEVVKQAFFVEEGATMFHVINAFTRAAQEPFLPVGVSYQMERIGGAILSMVKQ